MKIQEEIESDVRKVFDKMEKSFNGYFGTVCPIFDPECHQCKSNLIFSKFKEELWEKCVKEDSEN